MHLVNAPAERRTPPRATDPALLLGTAPAHTVQFYESDAFLTDTVGDFLAAGLAAGQPGVVIATAPHREAFAACLRERGFDVARARRRGQLTMVDAAETLATFMDGGRPDRERFRTTVAPLLERARHASRPGAGAGIRAFGEMVDMLWAEGSTDAALRLEELWNELARAHDFQLLCAYAIGRFYRETDGEAVREICRQHTHVVPAEGYTQSDDARRLVEISLLQQRARALETEIEQRKELERRLRQALAARAEAEEERERLLARERAARAEAEAANRAKSEFLAVMSHELRTPLNVIGGHVQLVEMGVHGPVTPAQLDALRRVQRSQHQLLSLINDVLNLVRVESGRVQYVTETIHADAMLGELAATVEPLVTANGLTCAFAPAAAADAAPGGPPPLAVRADREKTEQILLNLLTNAIKFTPPGGRVTLAAEAAAGAPGMVALRVRDTGVGIPTDKLESVFEPFVQLGARRFAPQQGVGLGLAISRELARGMGGNLTAECAAGDRGTGSGGTCFTLTLPRA